MKYYVGIDQGGSKTDVLIGDENGKLVARHIGPGWADDFFGIQIACAEEALSQYGLKRSDVCAYVSSMTGIDNDDIRKNCRADLQKRISNENVSVYSDIYGAWRAGTNCRPSGALAIGTAAAAAFFHKDGSATDISSLLLFEYQAASVLGFRAFGRACASALKYWEPTILTENICAFAQTSSLEEAFAKTEYGQDLSALPYQHFAPYVYAAACKNDKVAVELVKEIGAGLAGYIRACIEKFGHKAREIPFILNGSSLKGNGYILENVIRKCLADIPNLKLIRAPHEPVYGALMLAYDEYCTGSAPAMTKEDTLKFSLNR